MKSSFRIQCLIFFCSTLSCLAQNKDSRIDELKKVIPNQWLLTQNDSELPITRKDSVWLLYDMRTNAPVRQSENEEQYAARIRKYGKKIIPYYLFKAEPIWSMEKKTEVMKKNRGIDDAIEKLPAKYHIEGLRDNFLSAKGYDFFIPKTKKDSTDIAEYNVEKGKMQKLKTPLPEYNTSQYSLFKKTIYGHDSELNVLWPFEAAEEMGVIDRKLRELCNTEE